MRKNKQFIHVAMIAIVLGAIAAAVAYFGNWLPAPASREAGRIWFNFWAATIVSIVIFAVVSAAIIYSVIKFRAAPDDDSDGPSVHGHTRLEIAWTIIPTIIVVLLSVASAIVLHENSKAGPNPVKIQGIAQQYAFAFKYENGVQSGILRLPLGRHAALRLTALDVIHAFWVPDFGQKQDMVPGQTMTLVVTPTRLGTYPLICSHLCGLGHSIMRTSAIVMEPAAFEKWLADQKAALSGPPGEAGKTVFTNNGCAACHAFTAAGATGAVGPSLDDLSASATAAGQPLEDFIRESIVAPNKVAAKGYPANVMPQTFAQLPKDQLDALVTYIAENGKGGS